MSVSVCKDGEAGEGIEWGTCRSGKRGPCVDDVDLTLWRGGYGPSQASKIAYTHLYRGLAK